MKDERDSTPLSGPDEPRAESELPLPGAAQEAWKTVYFGQIAADLVPFHPEPPEAGEDELTQAALNDPQNVNSEAFETIPRPTVWRLLTVLLVAVAALAVVFWRN